MPPPVPARITGTWPERQKVPEGGPCPEGLRTGNEGAVPPPEDPRSANGAPPVTVRWPTIWPQGGRAISPISLAAVGQPR